MATKQRVEELEAALRLSLRFTDHIRVHGEPCAIGMYRSGEKTSSPCTCGYHNFLKELERLRI